MISTDRAIIEVVDAVAEGAKSATYVINAQQVVKCTRRGKPDGRVKLREYVLCIGKPCYRDKLIILGRKRRKEPISGLIVRRGK